MGERFEKVRTIGIVSSFIPWKDRDLLDALGTKDRAIFFAPGSRPPDNYTRIDTIFATTAGIIKTFFIFFPLSLLPRFLFVLLLNSSSEFRAEYFSLNASTARQGSPPMIATWLANGRGLWRWTTRWKLIKTLESSRRCISLRIFSINNRKTVDRRPSDDVYTVEQFFRFFFFINSYVFSFLIFFYCICIFSLKNEIFGLRGWNVYASMRNSNVQKVRRIYILCTSIYKIFIIKYLRILIVPILISIFHEKESTNVVNF